MSEGDKRFDPTPSRRERARREGNVPRCAEATTVGAFGAAVLAGVAAVPVAWAAAAAAVRPAAARAGGGIGTPVALLATSALAPACAAAGGAVLVALLQGGGLHLVPLGFDPRRLDPVSGLKRMLGAEAAVAAARAVLAFVLALAAMLPLATEALAASAHLGAPLAAAALVGRAALGACAAAFAVGAVFAFGDAALARRRWLHGLRMSFHEMKRDAKEHDGDPHARARRTRLHRAVVRGAIARTREASFVVVNPTHVAVALRYAPPQVPVPEILVRARDEGALCVRALAKQCAIPVVEDAALARLLYAQGESGSAIPVETYVAVAQAIASLARAGLLS